MDELFIGVDLGTGGVRALTVGADGRIVASGGASLAPARVPTADPEHHEQRPEAWWEATAQALLQVTANLRDAGVPPEALRAVAVDGTSGTLVCLDAEGQALRPGIMYNDGRAGAEAAALNAAAGDLCQRLGYRFAASYALAKIEWVRRCEPAVFAATRRFLHQGDAIESRLCGQLVASDYSNALKTGYDLLEEAWPAWIDTGVRERLPPVVAPGRRVGTVCAAASAATGLPAGLPVIAGATDGTAACLASGARRPGDVNTTLGTTLVFKAISPQLARHPQGLVYSHKLPGGLWLPGAASNTGGEWIETRFAGRDLATLDAAAQARLPSDSVAYPLARRGERFPFLAPDAEGFHLPAPHAPPGPDAPPGPAAPPAGAEIEDGAEIETYAAHLQGTALVERLAYETLDAVTGSSGGGVYSTGGGSRSDVWMQCRADVTGRVVQRPAVPESAFGSAVLAAAGAHGGDVWGAAQAMVRIEARFEPAARHAERYAELYGRLCAELRQRGWLAPASAVGR